MFHLYCIIVTIIITYVRTYGNDLYIYTTSAGSLVGEDKEEDFVTLHMVENIAGGCGSYTPKFCYEQTTGLLRERYLLELAS